VKYQFSDHSLDAVIKERFDFKLSNFLPFLLVFILAIGYFFIRFPQRYTVDITLDNYEQYLSLSCEYLPANNVIYVDFYNKDKVTFLLDFHVTVVETANSTNLDALEINIPEGVVTPKHGLVIQRQLRRTFDNSEFSVELKSISGERYLKTVYPWQ
jgi:hypothetical protein